MAKPENPSLVDFMWQPQNDSFSTQVTLRDLFAAFCAAGVITRGDTPLRAFNEVAELAHGYADAMLAEREK